jgi:hypothetical protein
MNQPDLLSWTPPVILGSRDGETFDAKRDGARLNRQMQTIYEFMADGRWHTLFQIAERTGCPEQSISARLRDLRKSKFGGYEVQRAYIANGVWQYRLIT